MWNGSELFYIRRLHFLRVVSSVSQNPAFYVRVEVQPWTYLHFQSNSCSCAIIVLYSAQSFVIIPAPSSGELSLESIISSILSGGVKNKLCGPGWYSSALNPLDSSVGLIIHHLLTCDADLDEGGEGVRFSERNTPPTRCNHRLPLQSHQ